MLFKDKVYGRTDDRQRPITIAHIEPSALVSLKLLGVTSVVTMIE